MQRMNAAALSLWYLGRVEQRARTLRPIGLRTTQKRPGSQIQPLIFDLGGFSVTLDKASPDNIQGCSSLGNCVTTAKVSCGFWAAALIRLLGRRLQSVPTALALWCSIHL